MSKDWINQHKRDHYYRKAKKENYRSRASFKLIQINDKYKIINSGDTVIDLGANPGGWSQVVAEIVGQGGKVLAIDLKPIEPIPGVGFFAGDVRSNVTKEWLGEMLGGEKADVIVSDMSPSITGNYSMDHARSMELAEMALKFGSEHLKKGGCIVIKIFDGDMMQDFLRKMKAAFKIVKRYSPKASRSQSSEIYVIGIGFGR